MHPTMFDALRLASVVVGSMSIGATGLTAVVYLRRYLTHRSMRKAGQVAAWRGLLPRHVAMLGASHVTLVALTMSATAQRFRHGPETLLAVIWSPTLLVAYALALLAIRDVLSHSKYRLTDRTAP